MVPTGTRGAQTWTRRAKAFVAALLVLAMATAGGAIYLWQRPQVRNSRDDLVSALQERDEVMQEVARLTEEVESLTAEAEGLHARVDRLGSKVRDLNRKLAAIPGCNAAPMLEAIRVQVDIAEPLVWETVSIQECQNGYARVLAHPGNVPSGMQVEDSEQVFLRYADGEWRIVASGTGITCADPDIAAELEAACTALGLQ